jgi:hypothetical protein
MVIKAAEEEAQEESGPIPRRVRRAPVPALDRQRRRGRKSGKKDTESEGESADDDDAGDVDPCPPGWTYDDASGKCIPDKKEEMSEHEDQTGEGDRDRRELSAEDAIPRVLEEVRKALDADDIPRARRLLDQLEERFSDGIRVKPASLRALQKGIANFDRLRALADDSNDQWRATIKGNEHLRSKKGSSGLDVRAKARSRKKVHSNLEEVARDEQLWRNIVRKRT